MVWSNIHRHLLTYGTFQQHQRTAQPASLNHTHTHRTPYTHTHTHDSRHIYWTQWACIHRKLSQRSIIQISDICIVRYLVILNNYCYFSTHSVCLPSRAGTGGFWVIWRPLMSFPPHTADRNRITRPKEVLSWKTRGSCHGPDHPEQQQAQQSWNTTHACLKPTVISRELS